MHILSPDDLTHLRASGKCAASKSWFGSFNALELKSLTVTAANTSCLLTCPDIEIPDPCQCSCCYVWRSKDTRWREGRRRAWVGPHHLAMSSASRPGLENGRFALLLRFSWSITSKGDCQMLWEYSKVFKECMLLIIPSNTENRRVFAPNWSEHVLVLLSLTTARTCRVKARHLWASRRRMWSSSWNRGRKTRLTLSVFPGWALHTFGCVYSEC